jgi:sulfide:quinone oxidoreductase
MIDPRPLGPDLSVAGQISVGDLRAIAARFRTLINNRPDGEEPGQPSSAEIEAAARTHGLDYAHIPVSGDIADKDVAAFAKVLAGSRGPVLAFCRTGHRSAKLWAFSQAGKCSVGRILANAAGAGYDLTSLEPTLLEAATAK